jgi:transposase
LRSNLMSNESKAPDITEELASNLRKANLSNLVKKVRSGKTLTAREMLQIEEASKPVASDGVSKIARKHAVSRNTIMRWRDQGLDLSDPVAVEAKVRASKAAAPTEDEKAAKLRKLQAEADTIEHKLGVQRGEFVSAAGMDAEGMRIGMAVGVVFAKMPEELPPLLAGQDAATIKKILTRWEREKRTELSQYESPIQIPQQ